MNIINMLLSNNTSDDFWQESYVWNTDFSWLIPRTTPYVARHLTWDHTILESNKRALNTVKLIQPTHTMDDLIKQVGSIKT